MMSGGCQVSDCCAESLQTRNCQRGARNPLGWSHGGQQDPTKNFEALLLVKYMYVYSEVGKPNQTIPKALLHPIPAIKEPFSHIIGDCVGPLPKTGNQYLPAIMCASTKFPEAIIMYL